jgi:uncharacterized protein (TIGR02145 family)
MKSRKIIRILCFGIIGISLYSCKPEEIILHGEISGVVTDTLTNQPLQAVAIKLNPVNDTTSTGIDGKYLLKNILPGNYTIEASKPTYNKSIQEVVVSPARTSTVDIALYSIPYPKFSEKHLDFGLDSVMSFTIKNTGTKKLKCVLNPVQDWITVNKVYSEVTTDIDTIEVTINRAGLPKNKQIGEIEIVSFTGQFFFQDTVKLYLNGVLDKRDLKFYGIVKIGTQIWLSENLNFGWMKIVERSMTDSMKNDGIPEKYCYDNIASNCDTYGGLYMWAEMMQYNPSDNGLIGITQGVCMDGWNIPSFNDWETLFFLLGGIKLQYPNGYTTYKGVGGKLKDTGPLWMQPNIGATNETGFTALPGGALSMYCEDSNTTWCFNSKGGGGNWWSSSQDYGISVGFSVSEISTGPSNHAAFSVRCIKDPPKK